MQQKLYFADLNSFSFPLFCHLSSSTPKGRKNQTQLDEKKPNKFEYISEPKKNVELTWILFDLFFLLCISSLLLNQVLRNPSRGMKSHQSYSISA